MRLLTGLFETERGARAPFMVRPLVAVAVTAALGAGAGLAAESGLGAAGDRKSVV